jgi:hypothetical protein
MAELTTLEEKLAEVTGLAMAAQGATQKVSRMVEDEELNRTLMRMNDEAKETEERCTQLADGLDGKKTAVLDKARETKQEATEMMKTYLGSDAEALDGFEFLTMAGARRVGGADPAAPLPGSTRRVAQARRRREPERNELSF